ncbi:hypothetical protein EV426DRAFT_290125 [Tirmania nivea]|nr:hypothetical protein EV426DRAFT_290125 [Tirmania nivea]
MSFTEIASQFTSYYYLTFEEVREKLKSLYRPHSMLTFETNLVVGENKIIETLVNLPLDKVHHKINTLDAQPCGDDGRILVMVTGHLVFEGSDHPQGFSQCFHLIPDGGSYYVLNNIFKLTYPA